MQTTNRENDNIIAANNNTATREDTTTKIGNENRFHIR